MVTCAVTITTVSPSAKPTASQTTGPKADLEAGPLRYDGYFGGLRVADVTLTLDSDTQAYETHMEIEARGVLGWFYTWRGELQAAGTLRGDRTPAPRSFVRSWEDETDKGATIITYDPDSGIAQGVEDGDPQEQVPARLRHDVVDPLATLVAMRRMALDNRSGAVQFPVYDGKRRLDLHATLREPVQVDITGTVVRAIPVEATIEPVAGFSDRQRDGWRQTTLHVLFSADDRALPLQIRVHSPVGTAVMNLSCIATCV